MDLFSNDRPDKESLNQALANLADQPRGPVPVWAFSVLKNFEECPHRVYRSKVLKEKGVDSEAASRGSAIHDEAEAWIKGEVSELPASLKKMEQTYMDLREQFESRPEEFELEQNWGFTCHWEQTGWFEDDTWCRMKLDVFQKTGNSALVGDHKSGKKWGNELKHSDQGMQYAIGAFKRYPDLEFATVKFWYLDKNDEMVKNYTRDRAMAFLPRVEQRAFAMTNATEIELQKPKPSKNNCRFCDHAKSGTCPWAIT